MKALEKILSLLSAPATGGELEDLFNHLSEVRETRIAAERELSESDIKRQNLLLSSEPVETILKHDIETDRMRLQLERLDLAEQAIIDKISAAQEAREESEWRRLFDERHAALTDYVSKLRDAAVALEVCKARTDALNGTPMSAARGFQPEILPIVAGLEQFEASVKGNLEAEMARREGRA